MQAISVPGVGNANPRTLGRLAVVALLLWACDAIAAPEPRDAQPQATTVAGELPHPALEITSSTLPSFELDRAPHSSRVDLSLMPRTRSAVGLSLGISTTPAPATGFVPNPQASQSLDLGLQWRYSLDSGQRFDVTAYRRLPDRDALSLVQSQDPAYGARFEMALGSSRLRKGFVADHGFVGLQLESGARLTVKRSGGVPMLYYRNTF